MIENQQFDNSDSKDKKPSESCEHRSERRTAQFLARQLGQAQDQLCDLINDMRPSEPGAAKDKTGKTDGAEKRSKRTT